MSLLVIRDEGREVSQRLFTRQVAKARSRQISVSSGGHTHRLSVPVQAPASPVQESERVSYSVGRLLP